MIAPCRDCDRKGCGAYHDECPTYLIWLSRQEKLKKQDNAKKALERALNKRYKH